MSARETLLTSSVAAGRCLLSDYKLGHECEEGREDRE